MAGSIILIVGAAKSGVAQGKLGGRGVRLTALTGAPRNAILLNLPDVRYPELGTSSIYLNRHLIGPTRLLWGNGGAIQIGASYEVQVDRLDCGKNGRSRVTIAPAKGTTGIDLVHTNVVPCRLLVSGAAEIGRTHTNVFSRVLYWNGTLADFCRRESVTVELPAGTDLALYSKSFSHSSAGYSRPLNGPFQWQWGNSYAIQVGEGYDILQDRLGCWKNGRAQITLATKQAQAWLFASAW